jgi:hypothetical protein
MSDLACQSEMDAAVSCMMVDPTGCGGCIDKTTLEERFPLDAESAFRAQVSFLPPSDPDFCSQADARMCAYHEEKLVCCLIGYVQNSEVVSSQRRRNPSHITPFL